MSDTQTEVIPQISETDQQKYWDLLDQDLDDDAFLEAFDALAPEIQEWSKYANFYAYLDDTSELAANQRQNESKATSENG
jgi:hypothetical protein